ncbi:hypothetical protein BDW42DRAFT_161145 [Aspergillus taichungensis]|uniref:Uncharacterized protein n=1 Tax=Aspergillus taichungensis TaxID=482145 RepID=A0A2J5I5C9_9EURO|nr:hypothetical protein BDW42DRAFT_161145 [Aspergillus taichungensis]
MEHTPPESQHGSRTVKSVFSVPLRYPESILLQPSESLTDRKKAPSHRLLHKIATTCQLTFLFFSLPLFIVSSSSNLISM